MCDWPDVRNLIVIEWKRKWFDLKWPKDYNVYAHTTIIFFPFKSLMMRHVIMQTNNMLRSISIATI